MRDWKTKTVSVSTASRGIADGEASAVSLPERWRENRYGTGI